jgi:hypothetical protein
MLGNILLSKIALLAAEMRQYEIAEGCDFGIAVSATE